MTTSNYAPLHDPLAWRVPKVPQALGREFEPGDAITMAEDGSWWFVPADVTQVPSILPAPW